jgi:hypothetical protein
LRTGTDLIYNSLSTTSYLIFETPFIYFGKEYSQSSVYQKLCFAQDCAQFNSEKVKILHAVSLVRGEAYDNNRAIFTCMTSHPDDVSSWTCSTSNASFGTLDRQYETLDPILDACIDFDQLFQPKTPFPNFIAKFETLAYQCGKTKEQKVEAPKKKILPGTRFLGRKSGFN